ncbi:hypothetical protein EMCRGX_G027761 [Ephydatia muelleri]
MEASEELVSSEKEDAGPSEEKKAVNTIPVPPPVPDSGISILAHKIWIGNLDRRLTEQNILEFVSRYGEVVSFRFMTFKQGPEKGEPRGYCFVEYSTREATERAKAALNGKKALRRRVAVEWARPDEGAKKGAETVSNTWDASAVSETLRSGVSTSSKIAALEAKLKQMEDEAKGIIKPSSSSATATQMSQQTHHRSERPYSGRGRSRYRGWRPYDRRPRRY